MIPPPRKRAQALAQGRSARGRLLIPLALETAACVSARPLADFLSDPTQLANGLLELHRALGSDGVCCLLAGGAECASLDGAPPDVDTMCRPGTRVAASLEACRRLRTTLGDGAALLAGLTGPATLGRELGCDPAAASESFVGLARRFCAAGADLLLVFEPAPPTDEARWADGLRTAANVARFHRVFACLYDRPGPLPRAATVGVGDPVPQDGLVVTDTVLPPAADLAALQAWIAAPSPSG